MTSDEYSLNENVFNHIVKNRNNRSRLQILVVEDDSFSRKLVTRTLKDYDLLEAGDGKGALKEYELNAPDMVFLDFELPDMTGVDILKAINKVDPRSFIVMLTSHTEATIVQEAVSQGAKGYIAKPFDKTKIDYYVKKFQSENVRNS